MNIQFSTLLCGGALALSLFAPPPAARAIEIAPTEQKIAPDVLTSTQWKLVSPAYAGLTRQPTLQFSENRLNASVGLNQINGEYGVNDLKLKISPLASTKMAGSPALMNAETQYARDLQSANSFALGRDGQTLTLRGDKTLRFERVNQTQLTNDPLDRTQWVLSAPNYAGLTQQPTFRFENGRVAASAGLNQIGGEYAATGKDIRVGRMLSTQMAGSPAQMAAESQIARALAQINAYEISRDGNILSLRGPEVLTLTRATPATPAQNNQENQNNPLAFTQWMATLPGTAGAVANGKTSLLQFTDKSVSASAGLNTIKGQYVTAASKISITALASTKMAGPPARMKAENDLIEALTGATGYEISPDEQTLTLRGKETLTYTRLVSDARATNPLAQTQWQLSAPDYAGAEKTPTLTFDKESLGASVGLNAMGAGYKVAGDQITLEQFISTMMAGPPALMEAEDAYKKALAGARTFEISSDGQTLILRGDTTLTFAAMDAVRMGFVPTETKIINVAAQLGPQLDGDQTPQYLQLEDLSGGASWGRFTEEKILGFDYVPGNRYQLRVGVERDANGEKQLRLIEVISQRYMAAATLGAGEKILEVAPTKVDCVGVAAMKCLQVREIGGPWSNFYAPIEGFDFAEGSRYRLQVKVSQIANPPADGSSLKYELVRVLDKTPVTF